MRHDDHGDLPRACASTGVVTSVHNSLCSWPIMCYGNEGQKSQCTSHTGQGR
ncbi:MAG: acyl-CoA dehydrogenase family protein [Desulfosudis oleivorans]|nr:acyl-CoA dehydrogenase family protein [Desulfosudis oleivorans]